FAPAEAAGEFRALAPGVSLIPQRGGDLGERMAGVFEDLQAAGARRVVLMGTDAPTLPRAHVDEAVRRLAGDVDGVLGPSGAGGAPSAAAGPRAPRPAGGGGRGARGAPAGARAGGGGRRRARRGGGAGGGAARAPPPGPAPGGGGGGPPPAGAAPRHTRAAL